MAEKITASPFRDNFWKRVSTIFFLCLVGLGVIMRLSWQDWHQGTNLHPDEYGLTNTIYQLQVPNSINQYFNTRISPLSPYPKYDIHGTVIAPGPDHSFRWGQFSAILIRVAAEITGRTEYDQIRVLGRQLSASADILILLLLYMTACLLYSKRIALVSTALSALAVMQIQQAHFMTADNFGSLFINIALFAGVKIARNKILAKSLPHNENRNDYRIKPSSYFWYALFGVAAGLAIASRINLLIVIGMIVPSSFLGIADLKLQQKSDLRRILGLTALLIGFSILVTMATFRLAHPISFRSHSGDTNVFTLTLNPDWLESMKVALNESNGIGGGPPAEQWANRPPILFPMTNMVLWGMGLPLGVTGWMGFLWATWRAFRHGSHWRRHLVPIIWVSVFFLFMGTRWVKSMRYFLPIYPYICLFAGWFLVELGERFARTRENISVKSQLKRISAGILLIITVLGTTIWAMAFTHAVYAQDHSRIRASNWIYENIPQPIMLRIATDEGVIVQRLGLPDKMVVPQGQPYIGIFLSEFSGFLTDVSLTGISFIEQGDMSSGISIFITDQQSGLSFVGEAKPKVGGEANSEWVAAFQGSYLVQGQAYLISLEPIEGVFEFSRVVIANESWDEGLPLPFSGYDPFGQFYRGISMEVRWHDDEIKRQMFLENLAEADYIILPSQRAIWSASRIPLMYPMTIEYYRALFDGRLGFELVKVFDTPIRIGPLYISDIAGKASFGSAPNLPIFNFNMLSAEEAFSVYDHPPVWIFKKNEEFSLAAAEAILSEIDLKSVVIQSPREATTFPIED